MSNIKSIRIKKEESEMLRTWIDSNKENLEEGISESEVIHRFIYLCLCKAKTCKEGIIKLGN